MNEIIIGVDEAGRGPLFGSVYTSAIILPNDFDKSILKDSKKFSSKKKIIPPESPKIAPKTVILFALKEVFLNFSSNGLDKKLTSISM